MTCKPHRHHVYWPLDFDIEGAGKDVIEMRGPVFPDRPIWRPVVRERAVKRSPALQVRVRDKTSGRGYRIIPGPADGTADGYGIADLWFLQYRSTELDDGVSTVSGAPADTQVQLSKHLDNENLDSTDPMRHRLVSRGDDERLLSQLALMIHTYSAGLGAPALTTSE